jgi:hypothetical protein
MRINAINSRTSSAIQGHKVKVGNREPDSQKIF